MSIKIEKNVPMPPTGRYRGKYPWNDMKVGDSFCAEATLSASVYQRNRLHPETEFVCRREGDKYRVWRIK